MTEWREVRLRDIATSIEYGFTTSAKSEPVGPKFLRITDIQNHYIDWASVPYCVADKQEIARYKLSTGDICIARTGASTGQTTIIKDDIDAVFASYLIRFEIDRKVANPFFIDFVLRSPSFKRYVQNIIGGSAQPNANAQQFGAFTFTLPPLPAQNRIAGILGALDDKQKCNRRINQTLEAMAQAIFKHWLVDFGPFRTREFVESQLGQIPAGWRSIPLDEAAVFLNGIALQNFPPEGENYLPVIKIPELRRGVTASTGKASANIPARYIVRDGDVLFSWSGSLEIALWCYGNGALNQHLFKVTSASYPKWFIYYWTKYHLPNFQFIAASKATTMGHIQRHHLHDALVVVPPSEVMKKMDEIMAPMLEHIIKGSLESRTLAQTRDYLLPKLLSGEIEVKAAEEAVEAIV